MKACYLLWALLSATLPLIFSLIFCNNEFSRFLFDVLLAILFKLKLTKSKHHGYRGVLQFDVLGFNRRNLWCLFEIKDEKNGLYKDLLAIEFGSNDFKKKTNASLLICRLKVNDIYFSKRYKD
ncbi:hypothetical protein R6Q59_028630 [Mikania micrantha]